MMAIVECADMNKVFPFQLTSSSIARPQLRFGSFQLNVRFVDDLVTGN